MTNPDTGADTNVTGSESDVDSAPAAAPTVMEQMGGLSGLVSSVLPVLVLVPVNQKWGLGPALVAAVGVAVLVFIWRLVRKETVMPAVSGLMGVGICAFIAWWMGDAKGYFAYGIWYSLGAGIVFVISVLVKWPLVGVIWRGVNGSGHQWRHIRTARLAFMWATLAWAVVFFSRFVVQQWLYGQDDVAWLGVARIAMGLPLTAVVVLATVWAVRVADKAERESNALTGDAEDAGDADDNDPNDQETV